MHSNAKTRQISAIVPEPSQELINLNVEALVTAAAALQSVCDGNLHQTEAGSFDNVTSCSSASYGNSWFLNPAARRPEHCILSICYNPVLL